MVARTAAPASAVKARRVRSDLTMLMGYDGVKTALAASKKEKVEAFVDTGANLVTKDNMSDPKIDALLNPKI